MGAWGHGYFDDDAALDFMAAIEDADHPKALFEQAFRQAMDVDYLEADEANAVIVAADYVDRQVNGTRFSSVDDREPLRVDTFPDRHPDIDLSALRAAAVRSLEKVLGENSELNELWAEHDEDYPGWRQGIMRLVNRLR